MRKKSSAGMIYTLDALIAISIILVAMFLFQGAYTPPKFENSLIRERVFNCLKYLDYQNLLREDALQGNVSQIENRLKTCIPSIIGYKVQICGETCTEVSLPSRKSRIIVPYYISGEGGLFSPMKIKVIAWGKI